MQRTACWITSLAIIGFVLGCDENKKEGMTMDDQGSVAYDYPSSSSSRSSYDSGSSAGYSDPGAGGGYGATDSYGYDSGGGYDSGASASYDNSQAGYAQPAYAAPASTGYSGGGGRMHTVARGDTLYSLARSYYNDQSKWRTIYQANQGTLTNPHQLRPGQQLVIP